MQFYPLSLDESFEKELNIEDNYSLSTLPLLNDESFNKREYISNIITDSENNQNYPNFFYEPFIKDKVNEPVKNENPHKTESINKISGDKENIFATEIKKSRGRQSYTGKKKKHWSGCYDNLQTKIQVHFFSFIINICNDALKTELPNKNYIFKEITYEIKRKVNHTFFEKLKKSAISEIFEFDISEKNNNFNKDYNKQLLSQVYNATNWLNKFFNINYLKLFEYYFYYNKEKQMNIMNIEGKNIILSNKTNTFCDLLKKKVNEKIKKNLIDTALANYFYDYDSNNKKFICS